MSFQEQLDGTGIRRPLAKLRPEGFEVIGRFFDSAGSYLDKEGQIMTVFSSLSQKGKIDDILDRRGFDKMILADQRLFFEELYVYRVWRKK